MRGLARAVVLVSLALAGCGSDDAPPDRADERARPLTLRVDTPLDGSSTRRAEVVVSGAVSPGARLTVDGKPVKLEAAGELSLFRARVPLRRGRNEIELVASRAGQEVRRTLRVRRGARDGAGDGEEQADVPGDATGPDNEQGGSGGSATSPEDEQGGSAGSTGPEDSQGGPDAAPPDGTSDPDDLQGGPQASPTRTPRGTDPDDQQGGPPAIQPPSDDPDHPQDDPAP